MTEPGRPPEPPVEPAELAIESSAPARPHVPTVMETVRTAVNALVESGGDLRLLSIVAVVFGVVLVAAPLVSAIAFFVTLPLFISFGATDDPVLAVLGLAAVAGLLAGLVGSFVLSIQFPLLIVAVVGGRISGQPLTLRQGLRRARQVFWRAVGASIAVGFVAGLPAGVIAVVTSIWLGPTTQLSLGVQILVSVLFASPWVYVMPGLVLGGVGAIEAIRRSWRLARFRWRLALTISLLGVVGGQIVTNAALATLGGVLTLASLAPGAAELATAGSPVLIAGAVLVGAVVVSSLFFATQVVEVAPETSGFYALTGYAEALEQARTGPREPLLRRPARVIYPIGLVATIGLAVGLFGAWPISERGPWQRQQAGSLVFDIPAGWQKMFEDPLGAGFSSGGGAVSIELDVAGSSAEDLVLRHLLTLRPLPVDQVVVVSTEEIALAGGTVREVMAGGGLTDFPVQLFFPVILEIGRIDGVEAALIVDYPASDPPIADLYAGEAKRFARHIWLSAVSAP